MSYRTLAEAVLSGRPYFGPALRAMQGVPERHQYFLPTVIEVARGREGLQVDVLEIGSWAGASAVSWAMALRESGASGTVTCVDPWLPYFEGEDSQVRHYRDMNDAARDGLIAQLFEHNIRCTGVADMIRQRRGDSRNVLPELPSGQFDIVYIDGSHRFEDVCFDIQHAKRLLRDDGVICGDDLEMQSSDLPADELSQAIAGGRDYVYSEASRSHYHPGVTGAVGREFTTVGVWDGFWTVRRHGKEWLPPDLDLSALRLPDHINHRQGQVHLLEATETHNLVESDGRYFAVHQSLGPVDLFEERLGERDLAPFLLTGASLDEVRRKALEATPSATSRPEPEAPVLAGSYGMFNLVEYQGRTFALRTSLGPVNVTEGEGALRQRFGPEDFAVASDGATAKGFIDHIELLRKEAAGTAELTRNVEDLRQEVRSLRASVAAEIERKEAAVTAELTRNVEDLREEIRSLRASAAAEIESHWRDISNLQTAQHKSGQDSDRLVERLAAETLAREKQYAELRGTLEAYRQEFTTDSAATRDLLRLFRQELIANWADMRDALLAGSAALHQFEQDVRNRLQSCADELSATVQAVSRKQDLLNHQVNMIQYGPGNADTICPAGEYLGFQLAYYRGHVYALRKPLDLDDINRDEQELLAAYGPEDVIVGNTLDGVRARVEIVDGLREVRDAIAAVDSALLAATCETREGLNQLDSVVRNHTHHLEKLSRRWPNRLFNK